MVTVPIIAEHIRLIHFDQYSDIATRKHPKSSNVRQGWPYYTSNDNDILLQKN